MRSDDLSKDFYLFPRARKKGRPIWYVQFRDPVTREVGTAKSSRLANETAAEKWARAEYERRLEASRRSPMILREWAERFFRDGCPHVDRLRLEGKSYAARTIQGNRRLLERFILPDPICDAPLAGIRRPAVLAYRDRLVAAAGRCRTAQVAMATLRIILREALFRELLEVDPFQGVGQIRYGEASRGSLSREAILALLDRQRWDDSLFWEATMVAAATGMRAGEVRALQWGDLIEGKAIFVHRALSGEATVPDLPKWGKRRVCAYPEALRILLEPRRGAPGDWVLCRDGGPISYKRWLLAFKAARDGAAAALREAEPDRDLSRLEAATIHSLRHTLNTRLLEAGADGEMIRGALGWSDPKIQERYTHREGFDYTRLAVGIDRILEGKHG